MVVEAVLAAGDRDAIALKSSNACGCRVVEVQRDDGGNREKVGGGRGVYHCFGLAALSRLRAAGMGDWGTGNMLQDGQHGLVRTATILELPGGNRNRAGRSYPRSKGTAFCACSSKKQAQNCDSCLGGSLHNRSTRTGESRCQSLASAKITSAR